MKLRGTAGRGWLAGAWATVVAVVLIVPDGAGLAAGSEAGEGKAPKPEPARLKVTGCGPLNNRRLRQVLLSPEPGGKRPEVFDANFIEDAAVLILSSVGEDGYLRPKLEARLTAEDGTGVAYLWGVESGPVLPRPLAVKEARFRVERGVRSHYRRVEFEGLSSIRQADAERYFISVESLIAPRSLRIYTPSRLKRSLNSLAQDLRARGFEKALVEVASLQSDERSGAVELRVRVVEGVRSVVRSVRVEVSGPGRQPEAVPVGVVGDGTGDVAAPSPSPLSPGEEGGAAVTGSGAADDSVGAGPRSVRPGQPHSVYWRQDFAGELQAEQYRRGYPDARVTFVETGRVRTNGVEEVDLVARVETGPRVRVGRVEVRGLVQTRRSLVNRRLSVEPGELLDRVAAEQGRQRLARLGVFSGVGLEFEPGEDPGVRDVVYEVREGRRLDASLLFGYGSYELLRGGFELEWKNLWGLAHQLRLRAVQSFKSSSGDALYAVPELIGEEMTVFANGSALRREEVSFLREEFGGGAGVRRFFRNIATDVGVRYQYQSLNASEADEVLPEGVERTRVGAFVLDMKHDGRDNPVSPHRGFKLFTSLELASEGLGGEVDYQRLELSASYHVNLRGGRYLHLGVSHGVAWPGGDAANEELPFNKRFFPGGANSIRGYQDGEAGPLNATGESIGAETFLLGNVEIEQALTPRWSIVGFFDALGFAENIQDYPAEDASYSVGVGVRWNTVIGPARLEYGHNLNPREQDPEGTVHFSLGFPF